jgi:hypothetical protein
MSTLRQFHFYSNDRRVPFIETLINYKISKTDGHIEFNGYYYILNEELPKRVFYITTLREEHPYIENITDTTVNSSYKLLEEKFYEIEIHDRQKIKHTSKYSEIDAGGEKMSVCFFPTDEQKIFFRVLKEFNSFEEFLNASAEHITEEEGKNSHFDKLE